MDLLSDSSNKGRVLVARHVAAEILNNDNIVNTTALCDSFLPPDIKTYLTALQGYGWILWSGGAVLVLAIAVLSCVTLKTALRHKGSTNIVFVVAVYPVIACLSYMWLVVPRTGPLAEALAQFAVMIAMYRLQRVIVADCGGTDEFVRRAAKARLETRLPPCCCWPCCIIPQPEITSQVLNYVRFLVLQLPIVQALIYIVLLVLWAEDQNLYYTNYNYFIPVIFTSIISGMWGMTMCVRAAESVGGKYRLKLIALQIALIVVKLQAGLTRGLPKWLHFPCNPPLTPPVYVNLVNNSITILEMLLLAIWAWRLYRTPAVKLFDKVQHVKVIATLDENLTPPEPNRGAENGSHNFENNNLA